jgi:radical SAM protein with 4Fe4S-binding SPASM domain
MSEGYVTSQPLRSFELLDRMKHKRAAISFDMEITARCVNDCRHCYINLPAGDQEARAAELTVSEIADIAKQAVELGALWCLLTGGEPLLRTDFEEIYMTLKRMGLLVSVFTTATAITEKHVAMFQQYPPRDVEVTVYGVTEETYQRVTRRSGSFAAFRRGLNLLQEAGVNVRLKAMALKSNIHEFEQISRFCRERTADTYRFDPHLHLRYDGDPVRNEEIRSERLSPQEIVDLERADPERSKMYEEGCEWLIDTAAPVGDEIYVFRCGAGTSRFSVTYDGIFRLCSSLWAPGTIYDLRKGRLADAWFNLVPKVRHMQTDRASYLETCHECRLAQLCYRCAAHAYLEIGALDGDTPYFCEVAHARAKLMSKEDAGAA